MHLECKLSHTCAQLSWPPTTLSLSLVVLALSNLPTAMSHDMHSGGSSSSSTMTMMVPYLHFTPGDTLLFEGWVPKKPGPIFGACIGLFLLAILDRWLAALRRLMEFWWAERARVKLTRKFVEIKDQTPREEQKVGDISIVSSSQPSGSQQSDEPLPRLSRERIPPFMFTHDLARGAFVVFQTAITYGLMLCVMTFNAGFIISILIGLGVGEVLFGRLAYSGLHGGH
ncbi:hypothetical protein FRC19_002876 [Serendipita sp. 401]|nr:hypothetical protein FRC19_002876 [Serendipita sp. 401]